MENNAINPSHYKQYPVETIEMMRRIWGDDVTAQWCIMTAFKYRMRMGHKDDIQQELNKEAWYLGKAAELLFTDDVRGNKKCTLAAQNVVGYVKNICDINLDVDIVEKLIFNSLTK